MCSGVGSRVLLDWVSPFGHPRITARLPAPRGLSQAPTSFIGSWCQGIHRVPLKTCHRKLKMLASTMQFSSYERNPPPKPAPTPTPTRTPSGQHEKRFTAAAAQRAQHTSPTAGARSLRTQQRAKPPTHQTKDSTPAETRSTTHQQIKQPTSRRSTHEQPPRNTRPSSGPGPDPQPPTPRTPEADHHPEGQHKRPSQHAP
jgi:hypothetical protein